MRASLSLIRFCGDVLIGCLALAAVWATGFGLLQVMPGFMKMVLEYTGTLGIFIAGGIVVPPVVLFVMGFARRRHGLTVSPLVAAGVIFSFHFHAQFLLSFLRGTAYIGQRGIEVGANMPKKGLVHACFHSVVIRSVWDHFVRGAVYFCRRD